MDVSPVFILTFALLWIAGPVTQLLQLVAPKLHHKLGMTEADAFKPEFRWYLLEEKAIAVADMSCLISGLLFLVLVAMGERAALIFGIYTAACYVYIALISIPRWFLLAKHELSPLHGRQFAVYAGYMIVFLLFGLFAMHYLWGVATASVV